MSTTTLLHTLALAAYGAGFTVSVLAFAGPGAAPSERRPRGRASGFIALGLILQASGLYAYGQVCDVFPAATPFGFFSLYALLAFVASLLACRHWRLGPAGAALQVIPLSTSALLLVLPDPVQPSRLPPLLLGMHLVAVLVALVAFTLAFTCGLMLLAQDRLIKGKTVGFWMESLPPLAILDEVTFQNVALGFVFLSLAAALGMVLVVDGPGAWALLTPKVLLTMGVWGLYGLYLHLRLRSGWRGRRLAVTALVGFVVVAVVSLLASFMPMAELARAHVPASPADTAGTLAKADGPPPPASGRRPQAAEGRP